MKEIVTMEREMLNKYQLDALVTMSPENITYITGAYIPTQVTVRSRKVIHIMTRNADPVVIVVNIEEPIMRSQSWMAQESIISYNEFTQNPVLIAIEKLKELGVESGRLGFEMSYVSANDAALLRRELPHAEIVDADPVFEEMRFIKLDFELQRIIELGSRIEDVIYDAIAQIRPGVDTKAIYDSFARQFTAYGYESVAFLGHGLGLTLHEEPYINTYKSTILQQNMVLCVEPIHVIDGVCGYQLENEVLVTADGHRMITGTKHPYQQLAVIRAD